VSGEKLVDVAEAQAEDVERAVQAARKAFDEGPWPRMTGEQRGRVLLRLADLVEVSERRVAVCLSGGCRVPAGMCCPEAGW
jgi:acyl-CoA reductase-like NAD-dependent aldehyde dehydrogenase